MREENPYVILERLRQQLEEIGGYIEHQVGIHIADEETLLDYHIFIKHEGDEDREAQRAREMVEDHLDYGTEIQATYVLIELGRDVDNVA